MLQRLLLTTALAALMLLLTVAFIVLGDRWAMQLRLAWDAGEKRYYAVSSHMFLPPVDTLLYPYVVECDGRDLQCISHPLSSISDASWVEQNPGGDYLMICDRRDPEKVCRIVFEFSPGRPIPPIKPPD